MREEVKTTLEDLRDRADDIRGKAHDAVSELPGKVSDIPAKVSELPGKVAGELPSKDDVQDGAVNVVRKAENAPSLAYMALVLGSMAASAVLLLRKKQALGIFVGLWPATILSLLPLIKERRKDRRLSQEIDSMRRRGETSLLAE